MLMARLGKPHLSALLHTQQSLLQEMLAVLSAPALSSVRIRLPRLVVVGFVVIVWELGVIAGDFGRRGVMVPGSIRESGLVC